MSSSCGTQTVPVVSLVFYRDSSHSELLLGVRRSTATSARHSDVLSTPTMRVPLPYLLGALPLGIGEVEELETGIFRILPDSTPVPAGVPYSLADPVAFLAESLMCRKLGVQEMLVNGALSAEVRAVGLAKDRIFDEFGGYEETLMLTLEVTPIERVLGLPGNTSSYSRLEWVDSARVAGAVKARDPLMLLPDASVWEVCLHGLCVRSAAFVLENLPGRDGG
jgi:hypothetical protein